MARPLRREFEGALYHLTGRGYARQRIFADQKDCVKFVQLLRESLQRYDVALHGYVLMGNHYHLIAGAGYTAVSQMIPRTREKDHKGALKFKLAALVKKCVK